MLGTPDMYVIPAKTPDITKQQGAAFKVLVINYITIMSIFLSCEIALRRGGGGALVSRK